MSASSNGREIPRRPTSEPLMFDEESRNLEELISRPRRHSRAPQGSGSCDADCGPGDGFSLRSGPAAV